LPTVPETRLTTTRSRNGTLDAQIGGVDIEPVAEPVLDPHKGAQSEVGVRGTRQRPQEFDALGVDPTELTQLVGSGGLDQPESTRSWNC